MTSPKLYTLLLIVTLMLPLVARASGNSNMNNSDTTTGGEQTTNVNVAANPTAKSESDASAIAFSATASKSDAKATAKNGDQTTVTTSVNSNTAKSGDATAKQAQLQGQDAKLSFEDNSVYTEVQKRSPVTTAAALSAAYCGGSGASMQTYNLGLSFSSRDYVCARLMLAAAFQADEQEMLAQLKAADARLDQEDTKVGNFFRRSFGSLPLLHFLAP